MSAANTLPPVLALTMGDVNGVGPEILAKALSRPEPWRWCRPVVFGSVRALDEARRFAPDCPPPVAVDDVAAALMVEEAVPVLEWGHPGPVPQPGVLDPAAGAAAVVWI